MKMNQMENLKTENKPSRQEDEQKILESLEKDVSHIILPLIRKFFTKGVIKEEEWNVFKHEVLRVIFMYLPYKVKLDKIHGKEGEHDYFVTKIKSTLNTQTDKLFNGFAGTRPASDRDGAEKIYYKLKDYISSLEIGKI